ICAQLPVFFMITFNPDEEFENLWRISRCLMPLQQAAADSHGVVYDLSGVIFNNREIGHFIAGYTLDQKKVFAYNDMEDGGRAKLIKGATISSHMADTLMKLQGVSEGAGKGALARHDKFWYPVRLIQFHGETDAWKVWWWHECRFPADRPLDPQVVVQTRNMVNELWQDRARRHAIWFGQWTHVHDISVSEDII
ncbi:uncharacterized protein F5891DRAFT_900896, partial [Suillus fuscotomentosus]